MSKQYAKRVRVLVENFHRERKPKGPRDSMATNVWDFVHFLSLPGGMTIKQAQAKFGVQEAAILRWKKKAIDSGVEITVTKPDDSAPVYTCDVLQCKLALSDAIGDAV